MTRLRSPHVLQQGAKRRQEELGCRDGLGAHGAGGGEHEGREDDHGEGAEEVQLPPSEAKISLRNGFERMERNSGDLRATANVEARKVRINVGGERDDCDVAVLVANTLLTS